MRPRRRTQRSAAGADLDTAISAGLRSPKYVQLYNSLREWIFEGRYPPGAKLPTEQELATRLRDRRTAAGLTQAELAGRIGVSRKTINTVENGVFVPSTLLALKLAKALKCKVEDLFFLD